MNNLFYKIIRLQQWIISHPRTASGYFALFSSVVIASFVIFVSSPKNINSSARLELAQIQPELQVPLQQTSATAVTLNTTGTITNAAASYLALPPTTNTIVVAATSPDNPNTVANNSAKIVTVKNKDSLTKIFQRLKLDTKNARTILTLSNTRALQNLKAGQKINFYLTPDQKLQQITYQFDQLNTLIVTAANSSGNSNSKFKAKIDHIEPTTNMSFITATVNGSIYSTAKKAGISRKMLAQITDIFKEKINLGKLNNGDKITVLRKDYYVKGQKIKEGDLALVELINKGKNYSAIAYTDPNGHTDFYTPEGYTLKSAFVRYPFQFKRISSPFSLSRYQPLLHIYRAHTGVDLAGTPGTPIKATSNGIVSFAGAENGYGNLVVIKHNQYSTAYAHLRGFAKQTHTGSYVQQGQVIGYLGDSGLSTGPHVHYEFRINGTPVDPVKVKLPVGEMIAKAYRGKFLSHAKVMLAQLNTQKHMYATNTNVEKAATNES